MRALRFGLILAAAALPVFACSSDEEKPGGNTGASCVPSAAECYGSGPSGPGAECLAKHDNTGSDKWQGRITQITVKSPPRLALEFIQETVIDTGVSLDQPACFERGEGTFNWLFEFDRTNGKLRTGGGLPVKDAAEGSCFVTLTSTPLPIAPITVDVNIDADGLGFSATAIDSVFVPIFASPDDLSNPIILPLHQVELKGTWNSDAHNCIGHFNGETLDPFNDCLPFNERSWTGGANLKGYITIDEADQVVIEELGSTLCVFIAGVGDWQGSDKNCKTSDKWLAGERPEGDWCSSTNTPPDGTCENDAWRLEGDFAAAAIKINGDCP
jgi:hypothetical protein